MDSLSAVAFATELSAQLEGTGVVLPSDFIFAHPSIGDMVTEICARSAAQSQTGSDGGDDQRTSNLESPPFQTRRGMGA
eukprot:39373-Eustigmatos_ZCMA.PRE.1